MALFLNTRCPPDYGMGHDMGVRMGVGRAQFSKLLHVLETNSIRITYCEGSWRKELQSRSAGKLKELPLLNPLSRIPESDKDYDTEGQKLHKSQKEFIRNGSR